MIYDILIIGGGPAGMTAAIYGARAKLKTLLIEKEMMGGQANATGEVENYPGFFDCTSDEIVQKMLDHVNYFGVETVQDTVIDFNLTGEVKQIQTASGTDYFAKSVILCPGSKPRSLNVKGEVEFCGRGVSYCAICDGDFFEELDVVIIGNGDAAIEEALFLTKIAKQVHIIVIHDQGILDCNKTIADKALQSNKINWIWNSRLVEINGKELVDSVLIENLKTGQITPLSVSGVFFFVGSVPQTEFLVGKVALDKQGYIITTEKMETDIPGIYAAGDARTKYLRQIVTSTSDGAIAAVSAEKYLREKSYFHEEVLSETRLVLLTFWSVKNEKSILFIKELEQLAAKNAKKVKLVKVDTSGNQYLTLRYQVENIPTVVCLDKGKTISRFEGFDANSFNNWFINCIDNNQSFSEDSLL